MKTYTVATLDDLIIATTADAGKIRQAANKELEIAKLSKVDSDGNEHFYTADDCTFHEGLVLADELPDGVDAEFESGSQGWLENESGETFRYAYRSDYLENIASRILDAARAEITQADGVDGNDPEEIAQFVMEGVLDNDVINNGGAPSIWEDNHDAIDVYTDNGPDVARWDDDAIDDARPIVRAMMIMNGNIKP